MSTLKSYIVPVLAVVAIVVSLWAKFGIVQSPILAGTNGNQYVENYDSLIRYNGGYNSQLPIQTSSTITGTGGFSSTGASTFTGSTTIGTSGSAISNAAFGTCKVYQYVNTIAATSSITTDCVNTSSSGKGTDGGQVALSGNVQSGDRVFLTLATSSVPFNGLDIVGAIGSSTPGYITFQISNQTGNTYTFQPGASTTLYYYAVR